MTLEQKQQTLTTALADMHNFIKNANVSNDETNTQLIIDSIVLTGEDYTKSQEARDFHQEQQDYVFDIINGVGFEDEDNISVEELDEILMELENALLDVEIPYSPRQKKETIEIAIAEVKEYIENGDHEHTESIKKYWLESETTFNAQLFADHYFNVTNSELTEGQQEYIFDLIQQEQVFEHETINHEHLDALVDKLNEELEELAPAE